MLRLPASKEERHPSRPDRGRLESDPGRVVVRRWGYDTFAAYVFDGDPLGTFVGTAVTRSAAHRLGKRHLRGERT